MEDLIITDKGETPEIINYTPIKIEQNEIIYKLNIKSEKNILTLSMNDKDKFPSAYYTRKMSFEKIKGINQVFTLLKSINDFYDYLILLSENKKLNLKKYNDKISIIFYVEILLKQQLIEIDLFPTKKDINLNFNEIYQELTNINLKMDSLKKDNDELNNKIADLKIDNKELNNKINKII